VRWLAALTAVLILSLTACTSDKDHPPQPPASAAPSQPAPAWATKVHSMQLPLSTKTGFAFYAFTAAKTFEVVSLDGETGRVRWRSPASPSSIVGGIVMSVNISPDKSRVIWLRPGRSKSAGEVTLAAADEASGSIAWTFGDGRLNLDTFPYACDNDRAICLLGRRTAGSAITEMSLDIQSGKLLADRKLTSVETLREVGEGLREDGPNLIAVSAAHKQLWSRNTYQAFGKVVVNPDYGWNFKQKNGIWVGSLGYLSAEHVVELDRGTKFSVNLAREWATAGLDAKTGRTIWTKPTTKVGCGSIEFDIDHPVVCAYKGTKMVTGIGDHRANVTYKGLDVTVQGIDITTGKATWSWHAGAIQGLYDGKNVVRLDDSHYAVPVKGKTRLLGLDHGPSELTSAPVGWCDGSNGVLPSAEAKIVSYDAGYRTAALYPCTSTNKPVDVAPNAPKFVGTPVNGVLAWADRDGNVRATRMPSR
jgi:hypothetical protein